jgi:hypothetical protein
MAEETLYEVGDEFEGSPSGANKFMHEVFKAGGLVEVDGSIVRIIYLPEKTKKAEAKKAEPKTEVKKEEPKAEVKKEESKEELKKEEAKAEETPKRGRPAKVEADKEDE